MQNNIFSFFKSVSYDDNGNGYTIDCSNSANFYSSAGDTTGNQSQENVNPSNIEFVAYNYVFHGWIRSLCTSGFEVYDVEPIQRPTPDEWYKMVPQLRDNVNCILNSIPPAWMTCAAIVFKVQNNANYLTTARSDVYGKGNAICFAAEATAATRFDPNNAIKELAKQEVTQLNGILGKKTTAKTRRLQFEKDTHVGYNRDELRYFGVKMNQGAHSRPFAVVLEKGRASARILLQPSAVAPI